MAANVYSTLFYAGTLGIQNPFATPSVPAGFVWVIRDIVIADENNGSHPQTGTAILDDNNIYIFTTYFDQKLNGYAHWSGHQVLNTGHHLNIYNQGNSTSIRISGYQLTLP